MNGALSLYVHRFIILHARVSSAAVLLVGFTAVWLALALVTKEGTKITKNELFPGGTAPPFPSIPGPIADEVCPREFCYDASMLPFLDSSECICGDELFLLNSYASDAYDLLILSVIGIYLLIFGTALAMMSTSSNYTHTRWHARLLGMTKSTAALSASQSSAKTSSNSMTPAVTDGLAPDDDTKANL